MARLDEMMFGMLISAKNASGEVYYDWRSEYYGECGAIRVYASEKTAKGKYYIIFNTVDTNDESKHFNTSYGDLFIDDTTGIVKLKTDNSVYEFKYLARRNKT